MTTDRELLELAAKAAGIVDLEYSFTDERFEYPVEHKGGTNYEIWNPLTDDSDALQLAVKCQLDMFLGLNGAKVIEPEVEIYDPADPYAATRRAIVHAAAEIGKGMK